MKSKVGRGTTWRLPHCKINKQNHLFIVDKCLQVLPVAIGLGRHAVQINPYRYVGIGSACYLYGATEQRKERHHVITCSGQVPRNHTDRYGAVIQTTVPHSPGHLKPASRFHMSQLAVFFRICGSMDNELSLHPWP